VGHVTPEAFVGGPIALVREGDTITIDADARSLTLHVSDAELAERRTAWQSQPPRHTSGVLAKFARLVRPANEGASTGE
jgi:dihydroxy-acid dehydratase